MFSISCVALTANHKQSLALLLLLFHAPHVNVKRFLPFPFVVTNKVLPHQSRLMSTFATPRRKDRALSSCVLLIQSLFSWKRKNNASSLPKTKCSQRVYPSWSSRQMYLVFKRVCIKRLLLCQLLSQI